MNQLFPGNTTSNCTLIEYMTGHFWTTSLLGFLSLSTVTSSEWMAFAMAVVCTIQRLHYQSKKREWAQQQEEQVDKLNQELVKSKIDNRLRRMESQLLRSVAEAEKVTLAFHVIFRRLVSNTKTDFAMYVNFAHSKNGEIVRSWGLADGTPAEFFIGSELLKEVANSGFVTLSDKDVRANLPYTQLGSTDRAKIRQLYLFNVYISESSHGVLLTTSLPLRGIEPERQVISLCRVLKMFGQLWRQKETLANDNQKLQSTQEILALREVVDQPFDSAGQMFEELMHRLRTMMSVDRCALYLCLPNKTDSLKMLARSDHKLQANLKKVWSEKEQYLINQALRSKKAVTIYDEEAMRDLGVTVLMRGTAIARLESDGKLFGVICLANQHNNPFSGQQQKTFEEVRQFLAETTLRLSSQASIQKQVQEDALTGLKNRRWFDQSIDREVNRAIVNDKSCSLLLIDLDRFKSVNDNYGHQMGDEVLKSVAQTLKDQMAALRNGDVGFAARYGGEELAILLPGMPFAGAKRIAEEVRQAIEAKSISFGSQTISVTASIGVASCPDHAISVDALVSTVDVALYTAKEMGRNRVTSPENALDPV